MIDKLHHLKQVQIEQELFQKQELLQKIDLLDKQISSDRKELFGVQVEAVGSIVDFEILAMHKKTMKHHIVELGRQKLLLAQKVDQHNRAIVQLQKESEQYEYLLNEQKKEIYKEELKLEALIAEEITQSKWAKKYDE
ncbi:MAG: hypothetical protein U9N30_04625 [Campylobacterota bacterium]|nr:hypothetical protein [Campylobacterota bacterium]